MIRLVLFVLSLSAVAMTQAEQTRKPNIVFVLADDLGWSELGCYGNNFHETPHLDRLAKEGMRFTNAYAAAPVCSPYRAALLTGQHPARIGILDYLRPNSSNALPTDQVTLPEVLSKSGYSTGMVGKWHLTGYRYHEAEFEVTPRDHGFAWDIGREVKGVGNGANFWPYVLPWISSSGTKTSRSSFTSAITRRIRFSTAARTSLRSTETSMRQESAPETTATFAKTLAWPETPIITGPEATIRIWQQCLKVSIRALAC